MAKVKVLFAEVEGGDEAVQSAIMAFVDRLSGPPAPVPPVAIAPVLVAHRPRAIVPPAAKPHEEPEPDAPNELVSSVARVKIVAALRKRPMTSREVTLETKLDATVVYYHLAQLRKAGAVEMFDDPESIGRKNRLVGAA